MPLQSTFDVFLGKPAKHNHTEVDSLITTVTAGSGSWQNSIISTPVSGITAADDNKIVEATYTLPTWLNDCELLCNFDGASGDTTFTDNSLRNLTIANPHATQKVIVDTSTKKFGTGCMYNPGLGTGLSTTLTNAISDTISGDFTIDFWANMDYSTNSSNGSRVMIGNNNHTGTGQFYLGIGRIYNDQQPYVTFTVGNTVFYEDRPGYLSNNVWQHIAITRTGTNCNFYIDGTRVSTFSCNKALSDKAIWIGYHSYYGAVKGRIDQMRVVRQCLWTAASFTPDTIPYGYTATTSYNISSVKTTDVSSMAALSSQWTNGYSSFTTMTANSGGWDTTESKVVATSGQWDSVFSSVASSSGSWQNSIISTPTSGITATDVNKIVEATYSVPSWYSNCELLVNFNGNYTDESSHALTLTANNGTIDASIYKFETGSLKMNGGSSVFGPSLVLANPIASATNSEFTIDWWARATWSTLDLFSTVLGNYSQTGAGNSIVIWTGKNGSNLDVMFNLSNTQYIASTSLPTDDTWVHFEVTRDSSSKIRIFVNGTRIDSDGLVGAKVVDNTSLWIGSKGKGGDTNTFTGYIDQFRILTNTCLHTATFVPDTTPYSYTATTSYNISTVKTTDVSSMAALSSQWTNGYSSFTTMTANSGGWETTESKVTANSSLWDSVYSSVSANSGSWGGGDTTKIDSVFSTTSANSGIWTSLDSASNQTSATYCIQLTDAGKTVWMNNNSANTLLIPTNAMVAFPTNTIVSVVMEGSGATTLSAYTGATFNGVNGGKVIMSAQYGAATLTKRDTDTWIGFGSIGSIS